MQSRFKQTSVGMAFYTSCLLRNGPLVHPGQVGCGSPDKLLHHTFYLRSFKIEDACDCLRNIPEANVCCTSELWPFPTGTIPNVAIAQIIIFIAKHYRTQGSIQTFSHAENFCMQIQVYLASPRSLLQGIPDHTLSPHEAAFDWNQTTSPSRSVVSTPIGNRISAHYGLSPPLPFQPEILGIKPCTKPFPLFYSHGNTVKQSMLTEMSGSQSYIQEPPYRLFGIPYR